MKINRMLTTVPIGIWWLYDKFVEKLNKKQGCIAGEKRKGV